LQFTKWHLLMINLKCNLRNDFCWWLLRNDKSKLLLLYALLTVWGWNEWPANWRIYLLFFDKLAVQIKLVSLIPCTVTCTTNGRTLHSKIRYLIIYTKIPPPPPGFVSQL
jgi:hypothetical protein